MNPLLANLLSIRSIEYLIISQDLKILEISLGVHRHADIPDEVKPGKDVRLSFPELVGYEDIIDEIHKGKQNNFNIKGILRTTDTSSPLYIDICIIRNLQENLIILVENTTERMVLEKSLVQSVNETNLLLRTLTASKQYIEQIITSMADALLVTTLSGKIKSINQAAQTLLEYDEAELINQHISKFIIYPTPLFKEIETVCQTKSGKKVPVAFSCSIVQTEIENFQGYVYILRDITERKQAELAKQEFLAMISHEIRTPISSVIGMASLVLNTELTQQQRDFVEIIETSGNALLKIINDILDFSKIDSGKLELEAEPFDLRNCISEALDIVAHQAREKGLKLTFLDHPHLPSVIIGDITRLRQILMNLLSNAIKFTETGSIEVSAIAHQNEDTHQNYEIQFAVKDTGIGIPSDRLQRLFKAFSQVNSSITRNYGGTGLGLAICKKLAELMGGRIWVESEPGAGSTFYFTITAPVSDKLAPPIPTHQEELPEDVSMAVAHPLRILLVEDHIINQKMVKLMLQQIGYQADVASNGLEALLALRRQPYDVVLMDVHMPQMDGITATKQIKQEWTPDICPRIVALTASVMSGDRELFLTAGMDDYLSKPIQIEELKRILRRCQPLRGREGVGEKGSGGEREKGREGEREKGRKGESKIQNSSSVDKSALQEILRIAEFNSEINSTEFLLEIITDYLEEAPKLLQDIRDAFSQNNPKTLRRLAHTFSSTSATLGATTLAALCKELEAMAVTEVMAGAAELISQIEFEYQQVQIALHQEWQRYQDS
ncbi:ATP-binding protein [Iningainema tapete]|uniref:Circadian input-output histidine kinase CikA n=1 Tax=Iningainema tapete BLCC-T55 TaxID=2748662 RepID=A0A8J6XM16_9CYAN|nr:ATP-binding protein [Iningainema tapete]MBD2770818.1 response regulator [Iningainema tapete BLCC-T55]